MCARSTHLGALNVRSRLRAFAAPCPAPRLPLRIRMEDCVMMETFEQQVVAALAEILEAEAQKKEKSDTLRHWFATELAPRVAAAIDAGAEEALAYQGLSAPERADAVAWMHEHALDVLRGTA